MLLSENNLEISGRMTDDVVGNEALEYKLMTVQVGFTFHTKIISDNLTIDVGPQLQYNGKMDLTNSTQESFYVNGYDNVLATDISEISQFNVNGMIGASAGFGAFKVRAQYIYGFTNMLNKLNDAEFAKGLNTKFKGNQSMIAVTAMLTF
jgi:heterodisulfide reductase subunit A-like polyferredoxin